MPICFQREAFHLDIFCDGSPNCWMSDSYHVKVVSVSLENRLVLDAFYIIAVLKSPLCREWIDIPTEAVIRAWRSDTVQKYCYVLASGSNQIIARGASFISFEMCYWSCPVHSYEIITWPYYSRRDHLSY